MIKIQLIPNSLLALSLTEANSISCVANTELTRFLPKLFALDCSLLSGVVPYPPEEILTLSGHSTLRFISTLESPCEYQKFPKELDVRNPT